MPTTETPTITRLPVAWSHEDGDYWFAEGHWSDEAMLLAVICEQLFVANLPTGDICYLLVGTDKPWTAGGEAESMAKVEALLGNCTHLWLKPDPDDEENMLPAEEGETDAMAWTQFIR